MAKQVKKTPARRVPRATEPRMYGDGKPSQPVETQQAGATKGASADEQRATPRVSTATRTPSVRSSGVTPRGAGASGSFARADRITDYSYVVNDLRRLGVVAVGILAVLVVLGIVLP